MISAAVMVGEISATACASTSEKFRQFGFRAMFGMTIGSVEWTICPARFDVRARSQDHSAAGRDCRLLRGWTGQHIQFSNDVGSNYSRPRLYSGHSSRRGGRPTPAVRSLRGPTLEGSEVK